MNKSMYSFKSKEALFGLTEVFKKLFLKRIQSKVTFNVFLGVQWELNPYQQVHSLSLLPIKQWTPLSFE